MPDTRRCLVSCAKIFIATTSFASLFLTSSWFTCVGLCHYFTYNKTEKNVQHLLPLPPQCRDIGFILPALVSGFVSSILLVGCYKMIVSLAKALLMKPNQQAVPPQTVIANLNYVDLSELSVRPHTAYAA